MTLSPRLAAVAALIAPGARIADIGTDHAYLPAALLSSGAARSAVAADLREGPLAAARETLRRAGLEGRVPLRLCDGLRGVSPGEADTLVIAGMGGETIRDILEAAPWTRAGAHTLVLQPMTKAEVLREYLYLRGFLIDAERLARDDGRLYAVLRARGGGTAAPRSGAVYLAGDFALLRADPLAPALLDGHIARLRRALTGAERSAREEDAARRRRMTDTLAELLIWRGELER